MDLLTQDTCMWKLRGIVATSHFRRLSAVLVVHVPFPFGVWGRMWNLIVSVPDHCLFINLGQVHVHSLTLHVMY